MIVRDIVYRKEFSQSCQLDLYLPEHNTCACPLFLYFHGGGLTHGGRRGVEGLYQALNKHGIAVAAADYRLFPETQFPGYIEDCAAAAAWLIQHGPEYGSFTGLYIGGSSAGAYLSMMLCFDNTYLKAVNVDISKIDGFLFDAGQPTSHFHVLSERKLDSRRIIIDDAAPLYYIDHDFTGDSFLPKLLLIAAEHDMPGRLEQNTVLLSTLLHFGYPPQKLTLHVIKDHKHCTYLHTQEYLQLLTQFIC